MYIKQLRWGGVSIDEFFKDEKVDFIKVDIEGAESQLVEGAAKIMARQTPLKMVLCTYHQHDDAEVLNKMLTQSGFCTEFSKGYMLFFDKTFAPPYLRRGLIRAVK
ncbi:hypothetical protein AGMMS4956_00760 [Bacteroidia bacterium]|nr:hypothetical protein AGMMS4956_00760 [Bacteroidia bacterium]